MTTSETRSVLLIPCNEGEKIGGIVCKVRSEQTDGAYSILEFVMQAGQGTGAHVHHREDEILFVVEGTLEVQYAGETNIATTNSVIVLPKHIPHAFRNSSESVTRLLITCVPGGLEKFFEELSTISPDDAQAAQKVDEIARRHQIDFNVSM